MLGTLSQTIAFQQLAAATGRPHEILWDAYTLPSMRQPLHHRRLGKAEPKPKIYEPPSQSGLAIVNAFSLATGAQQAIVRVADRRVAALSLQPRPFEASWTAEHALIPPVPRNQTGNRCKQT
jgi:hypothetical protein